MTRSINVVGIMIGKEAKDFKLYHLDTSWEEKNQGATYVGESIIGATLVEGTIDISGYLSTPLDATAYTLFVVVYDVTCPNKEQHIKDTLVEININNHTALLPIIVSIGQEQSPLSYDITTQVSNIKEVTNSEDPEDLFKRIIQRELHDLEIQLVAAERADELRKNSPKPSTTNPSVQSSQTEELESSSLRNISMMVLGGFIAAVGIAAVAVAFTLLNAATFGVAGLIVAGIGIAATLSGVGLFGTGAYKNSQTTADISLDSNSFVHP